jgi:hypothetical protein
LLVLACLLGTTSILRNKADGICVHQGDIFSFYFMSVVCYLLLLYMFFMGKCTVFYSIKLAFILFKWVLVKNLPIWGLVITPTEYFLIMLHFFCHILYDSLTTIKMQWVAYIVIFVVPGYMLYTQSSFSNSDLEFYKGHLLGIIVSMSLTLVDIVSHFLIQIYTLT